MEQLPFGEFTTMLSWHDLKYHCRTCLIKVEESMGDNENTPKYVTISKFPEVEHLIRTCLSKGDADASDNGRMEIQMPNLCCICFEKWQDFATHYKMAMKNDATLRKILEREEMSTTESADKCEQPNKVFLQSETNDMVCEIEKYETVSPFYPTSHSNTPIPEPQIESVSINSPESITDEWDNNALSSPKCNSSGSDDNPLCGELKSTKTVIKKSNHAKLSQVRKTRNCRSRKKPKTESSHNSNPDKHLASSNENSSKKVAYRCEPCKKFFYGSITYEGHMKRVHEGVKKAYQCKECDKAYSFPHNLVDHIAENHNKVSQGSLQCEHCKKSYKNKASLVQHLRNHHQDSTPESKRIICDQCGFLAAHQLSLVQHIKNKHTEVEEVKCDQCSKVFKSHYYLKYHMMSFHNPMNIKPFKCPQCPMAFTRRPRLNIHIRTHLTYSERIKCDYDGCDVRFVKLSAKRRHMRLVHLKVKQHICDICGEAFGIKATLTHHRYIHTGEKPYKCNICGQAFRQLTAMKTHRKMHVNKEPGTTSNLAQIDGSFEISSTS